MASLIPEQTIMIRGVFLLFIIVLTIGCVYQRAKLAADDEESCFRERKAADLFVSEVV